MKAKILALVGSIGGIAATLGLAGHCFAEATPTDLVALPPELLPAAIAYLGQLFGDLSTLIALVVGLPIAFWIIHKVISLVKVRS